MLLDIPSPTAFTPAPLVLYNPAVRRAGGSLPDARPRGLASPKPNASASTADIQELPIQYETRRTASALKKIQTTIELLNRLQFLMIEAERDGITFSEASLADFKTFMRGINVRSRPSLFLNDNGNLRALWKNEHREQVGIQFLGDGAVQFVIFKKRRGSAMMTRVAGVDSGDKILGHIRASGAEALLSA
jgi:hypothetical protein